MQGLQESFISGYHQPAAIQPNLSGVAELVVTRNDSGQGKGYVWLVAITLDGKAYYRRKPFKPKEGHYFDLNKPVPLEKLFGQIQIQ